MTTAAALGATTTSSSVPLLGQADVDRVGHTISKRRVHPVLPGRQALGREVVDVALERRIPAVVGAGCRGVGGERLEARVRVARAAVAASRERRRGELLERRAERVLLLELQRHRAARLERALVAAGMSRVVD